MFEELFSIDNLFYAWKKFKKGKSRKKDVIEFEYNLEDNIFSLHTDIISGRYQHGEYSYFRVFDSKKRDIHKACVRDRVIHQIIYQYLSTLYESVFIKDSYSSRIGKGNLKAVATFKYFLKLCEPKHSSTCFVLKCDIKKYFEHIDHQALINTLSDKIVCLKTLVIIKDIINSFSVYTQNKKGIPLGNITSQIFANIYLHRLDIFIKHTLKCRYYIRYNDDFVIVSQNQVKLFQIRDKIIKYVKEELYLEIPHNKTTITKSTWGIDFLGYVILLNGILLRNKTKHKIFQNINQKNTQSYLGLLKWCDSYALRQKLIAQQGENNSDFPDV